MSQDLTAKVIILNQFIRTFRKGEEARKEGKLDESLKYYNKCLDLTDNSPKSWNNLATVFNLMGKHDEASLASKKALELELMKSNEISEYFGTCTKFLCIYFVLLMMMTPFIILLIPPLIFSLGGSLITLIGIIIITEFLIPIIIVILMIPLILINKKKKDEDFWKELINQD